MFSCWMSISNSRMFSCCAVVHSIGTEVNERSNAAS
jgi:hypothetical protein